MSRCSLCGRKCPCVDDADEILQLDSPGHGEEHFAPTRVYTEEELARIKRAHISSEVEGDSA